MDDLKKSIVYFADMRTDTRRNLLDKIDELLSKVAIGDHFTKGQLIAVKLHFGEKGNLSYLSPVMVRRVVERIKDTGATPFLTDTNTLYTGTRSNAASHLKTAIENGFDYSVTGAPIVIADGLRGEGGEEVEVDGKILKGVHIAQEIISANGIVVLTHFKGHEMSGFGGTLKNIGMGCASREGKLAQHSSCAPTINGEKCHACGDCVLHCPVDAIDISSVAVINEATCIGCGHCISVCPEGAVDIVWNETTGALQQKMTEHVAGALKGKEDKALFMNFIMQVSPFCDCYGNNDAPIVPDIGILASTDPVALDKASADMVNKARGFAETALTSGFEPGGDKFRGVHPKVDWTIQLKSAEALGLGSIDYTLNKI